jgi:hypothetical protein
MMEIIVKSEKQLDSQSDVYVFTKFVYVYR